MSNYFVENRDGFVIKSDKDKAVIMRVVNGTLPSGKSRISPRKSPYVIPATVFLLVSFAGIIAALQVPQVQAIFSLFVP